MYDMDGWNTSSLKLPFKIKTHAKKAKEVTLSDGSIVNSGCVMLSPANEDNDLGTFLILVQFGGGARDNVHPVLVSELVI